MGKLSNIQLKYFNVKNPSSNYLFKTWVANGNSKELPFIYEHLSENHKMISQFMTLNANNKRKALNYLQQNK